MSRSDCLRFSVQRGQECRATRNALINYIFRTRKLTSFAHRECEIKIDCGILYWFSHISVLLCCLFVCCRCTTNSLATTFFALKNRNVCVCLLNSSKVVIQTAYVCNPVYIARTPPFFAYDTLPHTEEGRRKRKEIKTAKQSKHSRNGNSSPIEIIQWSERFDKWIPRNCIYPVTTHIAKTNEKTTSAPTPKTRKHE